MIKQYLLLLVVSALVVSCGGGGASTGLTTLTGTTATGAPIAGFVYVRDAKGTEINIATGVNGSFALNATGMTPPFMIKVVPANGAPALYSYASSVTQTVNLTPLTNMAMFLAGGSVDLATLYAAWNGTGITAATILNAQKAVNANFTTQITAAGLDPTTYDFFTTAFSANGTGIDGMMDTMQVTVTPGTGIGIKINAKPFVFNAKISIAGINIAGGAAAGAGGGTLTIAGDPMLPANVNFTAAVYTNNVFSTDVVWTFIDAVAGKTLSVTVVLAHPGVAANLFPGASLAYSTGGIPPTTYFNWGATAQATAGLVVDQKARTATFTNVQLPGMTQLPANTAIATTVTVNGTLTY
ncbi:hypothetical protein D8Y20_06040 [Mariprofundus sp. EBB-1]|nr:hypothetical protein D8Y20_06040 [Mariprofundus sp. EBB-1]